MLIKYLRPQARRTVALTVLLLGSIGLQLVNPQIVRRFIDATQSNDPSVNLTFLGVLFIAVALVQQALAVAAVYFSERVGWTATNALRSDLALHCLRLDLSFHKARTPGELIERIDGDVTSLANFFSQFVIQILGSLLLLIGVVVVMWTVDWRVGVSIMLFAFVVLFGMLRMRSLAVPHWTRDRQASAELFGYIEERLAGTVDVRSSGAQPYVMRRLYEHARPLPDRLARPSDGHISWTVRRGVRCGQCARVRTCGLLRTQGLSLGSAFAIYYYTQMLSSAQHYLPSDRRLPKASAGIVRIQELFNTQPRLAEGRGDPLPDGALSVQFDRVSFEYEADDPVLQELTFEIEPGRVLGLLGRTGSGKTTLSRLLLRLYDATDGSVRLGGVDVRDAAREDLRRRIGVVTQDVQLFRATVRDNLTFFDPKVGDDRIIAALGELGLTEWYRALPEGLDTMLAASGGGLSAGEAQLLAFTRVFLKDPSLVVLDEASSRLDPATERLIERAVGRLLEGRTGVVIAHRLGTVQRADAILILEDGRVVEHGPRESLVADPRSRFSTLLRTV
ncbi:MAG: ABC transporter ATP-binding protein [Chloroflexia bacterium]